MVSTLLHRWASEGGGARNDCAWGGGGGGRFDRGCAPCDDYARAGAPAHCRHVRRRLGTPFPRPPPLAANRTHARHVTLQRNLKPPTGPARKIAFPSTVFDFDPLCLVNVLQQCSVHWFCPARPCASLSGPVRASRSAGWPTWPPIALVRILVMRQAQKLCPMRPC